MYEPPIEPTLLERSEEGQLGTGAQLDSWGLRVPLLKATGSSQRADALQVLLSLDFDPSLFTGVQPHANVLAVIELGQGGTNAVVDVDFHDGATLNLPASALSVLARFQGQMVVRGVGADANIVEDPALPPALGTYGPVQVSAQATAAPKASRSYPTRSYEKFSLPVAPDNRRILRIPLFAYAMQLYTPNFGDYASLTVRFQGGSADSQYIIADLPGATFAAALLTDGVKFPDAARFVQFRNAAAVPVEITPSFALNL